MTRQGGEAESRMDVNPEKPAMELARRSLEAGNLRVKMITPEDVYDAWLEGRNERTQRAYMADLRDFGKFLGLEDPVKACAALVAAGHGNANRIGLAYRADMGERGLSAATIAHRLAALRSMVKLARQIGQIDWNLDVPSPKVQTYRDTRGPGDDGWKAMRQRAAEQAKTGDPVPVRNRAILRVTHDLGLRVGELVGLDLADVEIEGELPSSVWILGKGRTEKERLTIAAPTAATLAAWILVRGMEPGPLFVRLDRALRDYTRLTDRSVRRMVTREGKAAGVGRRVKPHGLRHHAITDGLVKTGGNVALVQRFSRHMDVRTVMVYNDNRADSAGEVTRLVAEED